MQIRYLYGPGIDHILESVDGDGTKQHFADALGSVAEITDSLGVVAKSMTYDSFGNIVAESGSAAAEEVSYTGRERESEFGLYYYRARYYDPLTGRFISRDPLGFGAGDVNLYRYVGNQPVGFKDPFGLWSISITWHTLGNPAPIGFGGTLTFGSYEGTHFWHVRGGVGVGGGIIVNLDGRPPEQLELNPCLGEESGVAGGIETRAGAGAGIGPYFAGGGYHLELGAEGTTGTTSRSDTYGFYGPYDLTGFRYPFRGIGLSIRAGAYIFIGHSWR